MSDYRRFRLFRPGRAGCPQRAVILRVLVFLLCFAFALPLPAAELKVEARLIWGTNDEKISDPKCKPLDNNTATKFRKIFKWKHYFEVNRQIAIVPSRNNKKITLSPKCTIDIKELEGPKVEVMLIGEDKPVNKTIYPLSKGESFIIAGDLKNGSAWFIIITELDEK